MTDLQLRALLDRIAHAMAKMTGAQRELVARHVLGSDPDLAPALPALVAATESFRGDFFSCLNCSSCANASASATYAPVMDAVRVPPSA